MLLPPTIKRLPPREWWANEGSQKVKRRIYALTLLMGIAGTGGLC
jgi:hypothetical protein